MQRYDAATQGRNVVLLEVIMAVGTVHNGQLLYAIQAWRPVVRGLVLAGAFEILPQ